MRELHLPLRNCNTTPTRLATFIYIARSLFWGKFARMLDKKTTHLPNLDNLGADPLQSCTSRASLTASRLQTRSLRASRACPQRMQENHTESTTMTQRMIEENTLDAWRLDATLSAFLLVLTFGAVVFNVENEQAMQRCLRSNAEKAECLLTVYGR